MCLSKIYPKNLYEDVKEKSHNVAWKVVSTRHGKLFPPHQGFDRKPFPVGIWLKEKDWRHKFSPKHISDRRGNPYTTGFHLYCNKEDAEERCDYIGGCIRKVYYRKGVAFGVQNDNYVIVVKEMFVVRKGK